MTDYKKYEPFFNAWYIKKKIGSGSFGDVYEVERKEFDKVYRSALKIISIPKNEDEKRSLKEEIADDASLTAYYDSAVKSISDEMAIMSEVKGHTNIVSYEDHEVIKHEDGIGYDIIIRMELLTLLTDYQKKHHLKEQDVIKLGVDLCNALDVCEMKNIIHRDIKPANIFVSDTGDFKLGDFGIARTIEATTSELSKKGTYTYMAPEVYMGRSYDSRADIYSLGLVMYTLLNKNRLPFYPLPPDPITYTSKENAIRKRLGGEPLKRPVSCSKELGKIILKACAYNPNNRYRNAAEFRNDLLALAGSREADLDKTVVTGTVVSGTIPAGAAGTADQTQKQEPLVTSVQGIQTNDLNDPDLQYGNDGNEESVVSRDTNRNRILVIIACLALAVMLIAAIAMISRGGKAEESTSPDGVVRAGTVARVNNEFKTTNVHVLNRAVNYAQVSQLENSDNMKHEKMSPEEDGIDILLYVRNDNDAPLVKMDFTIGPEDSGECFRNLETGDETFSAVGLVGGHCSGFLYVKAKTDNKWADPGKTLGWDDKVERGKVIIDPLTCYPGTGESRRITLEKGHEGDNVNVIKEKKFYWKVSFTNNTDTSAVYDKKGVKIHKDAPYVVMIKGMENQSDFKGKWGAGRMTESVDPGTDYSTPDGKGLYNPRVPTSLQGDFRKKAYIIVFDEEYLKPAEE